MKKSILNIVLFQIGWFACVLGAANNYSLAGSLVAVMIITLHLLTSKNWLQEMLLVTVVMLIGFAWDSLLVFMNWIDYPAGQLVPATAPYWIVIMWGLFSTTLNVSLSWLKDKLVLSIIFGAVGGPLAYYAGAKLGALELINREYALLALSVGWGILTPLLLQLSSYLQSCEYKLSRRTS
ncbi:MAG: DUF2878 domain-containing protein [Thioalkalispiraceae bacterium]|jgi:hypothetical protein